MSFKNFWYKFVGNIFEKKLSSAQIKKVQDLISKLEEQRIPSSKIISILQNSFSELREKYQAERAYWTEAKKKEAKLIFDNSDDLGLKTFRIVTSPGACEKCRKVAGNDKHFSTKTIQKDGKPIIPVHPNCYCVIVPVD